MRVRSSFAAGLAVMVFGLALSLASSLRADVIGLVRAPCPTGAYARSTHSGALCSVSACQEIGDCARWIPGERLSRYACAPAIGLCIERVTRREVSQLGARDVTVETAHASCEFDGDCGGRGRCERARRCVIRTAATR